MRVSSVALTASLCLATLLLAAGCGPPPTGNITIDSRPSGATVTLNGKTCPSPCNFELPPGDYPVVATLMNYGHAAETITIVPNQKSYRTLHLYPMVPTEDEARRLHLRKKPEKTNGAYQF